MITFETETVSEWVAATRAREQRVADNLALADVTTSDLATTLTTLLRLAEVDVEKAFPFPTDQHGNPINTPNEAYRTWVLASDSSERLHSAHRIVRQVLDVLEAGEPR